MLTLFHDMVHNNKRIGYGVSILGTATIFFGFSCASKYLAGSNPFDIKGLIVPISVGSIVGMFLGWVYYRINSLNRQLRQRVTNLEKLLPICAHCKKIRLPKGDPKDQKARETLERYITSRTDSEFSHGVCPECVKKYYAEFDNND